MVIKQEEPDWQVRLAVQAEVGEEPIYTSDNALFWVDINAPSINRLDLATGANRTWKMPELIGTYALSEDCRRALVALQTGLFELDLATGGLEKVSEATYDTQNYRYNDGRCDRAGRFWVGTIRMHESKDPDGLACFYRYDGRGVSREIGDLTIANGLAWSPDNRTMYLANRPKWEILAFDYDIATGIASNRRRFATIPVGQYPDGATVDEDGGYWVALYAAGRIVRFNPDGTQDRDLKAPTSHPTMVAFGGPDYRTLFVTTACSHLSAEARAADPGAGAIYSIDVDRRGLPEPSLAPDIWKRFAG